MVGRFPATARMPSLQPAPTPVPSPSSPTADSGGPPSGKAPDFADILSLARRAAAAYDTPEAIRAAYPNTEQVSTLPVSGIQYFLETDPLGPRQWLAIRGTCNRANFKDDADCWEIVDADLGIVAHRGFALAARELSGELGPHLRRDARLVVTGHSLGAAVAVLIMALVRQQGVALEPTVNFGQPKVTNAAGADRLGDLPVMRVVDENDLVPLLPPNLLFDQRHGSYAHFGPELILLRDEYYVWLDRHRARDGDVAGFWRNLEQASLEEHYMANYLRRLVSKQSKSVAVPFEQREAYVVRDGR